MAEHTLNSVAVSVVEPLVYNGDAHSRGRTGTTSLAHTLTASRYKVAAAAAVALVSAPHCVSISSLFPLHNNHTQNSQLVHTLY
jgi:hypothetical protein